MPRPPLSRGELAVSATLALLVALLLRWPVSVYIHELPLDPNTPLHALAARDLAGGGSPWRLEMLGYPDGATVRLLAWPLLLLALPLQSFLPAIAAFNVAVLLWLALQGLAIQALLRSSGGSRVASGIAALATMAAPSTMLALSNGQYENIALLPVALAVAGAWRGGARGWAMSTAGLVLAVFSSPYQGIVAGAMAVMAASAHGVRRVASVLAASALAGALALPYFLAELPGEHGVHTGPASIARREPAVLGALVLPRAHPTMLPPPLPTPAERIEAATVPPFRRSVGTWPTISPVAASYLGLPLMLGVIGLWRSRTDARLRGVALGGLVCLVLAFGHRLTLWPGWQAPVPLPWALADGLPGLWGMQVTLRFLPGVSFALALGLARLCETNNRRGAWIAAALLIDGLLVAPVWWPVPAAGPRVGEIAGFLPPGPIAVWPGSPSIATDRHALLALALGRPVALFDGAPEVEPPTVRAHTPRIPDRNLLGESPAAWLERVRGRGVRVLIALPVPTPGLRQPFFEDSPTTVDGLDLWMLDGVKIQGDRPLPR